MRLYGYTNEGRTAEVPCPATLAEVTLCASAEELRQIAAFFASCADEMERMGGSYDHVHLSDRLKHFQSSPHLVVARP
jgi:hypothetical protein